MNYAQSVKTNFMTLEKLTMYTNGWKIFSVFLIMTVVFAFDILKVKLSQLHENLRVTALYCSRQTTSPSNDYHRSRMGRPANVCTDHYVGSWS